MSASNRRKFLGRGVAAAAAATTAAASAQAQSSSSAEKPTKRVIYRNGRKPENPPLFSGTVAYGNLLFISGVGYHQEGDIKVHTEHVLESIKQQLESAGSSMEKVLKCNVYLNDLKDYAGMNEVFKGKFGAEPPVRTTIAAAGGIPGNSLVEIDVIAYI
jgi:enamine deaminase RidA (YjgF/YER057c/UK114 family)